MHAQGSTAAATCEDAEDKTATAIENVREFKAGLAVSHGPVPVKDLSEFEELDPKL